MFDPLNKVFKYSDVVIFEVTGELPQAVDRLSHAARKPVLQATWGASSDSSLVGRVTRDDVRLHKVTPLFGNIFKPIFVGKFYVQDHKIYLRGTFEMGLVARLSIWFPVAFCLVIQFMLLPLSGAQSGIENLWPMMFLGIGMLFVVLEKMAAKQDVQWVKRQIETALAKSQP